MNHLNQFQLELAHARVLYDSNLLRILPANISDRLVQTRELLSFGGILSRLANLVSSA